MYQLHNIRCGTIIMPSHYKGWIKLCVCVCLGRYNSHAGVVVDSCSHNTKAQSANQTPSMTMLVSVRMTSRWRRKWRWCYRRCKSCQLLRGVSLSRDAFIALGTSERQPRFAPCVSEIYNWDAAVIYRSSIVLLLRLFRAGHKLNSGMGQQGRTGP